MIDRLCDPDPERPPTPAEVLAAAPAVRHRLMVNAGSRVSRRDVVAVVSALVVGLLIGAAVMLQQRSEVVSLTRSISGVSEPGRSGSVVLELPDKRSA